MNTLGAFLGSDTAAWVALAMIVVLLVTVIAVWVNLALREKREEQPVERKGLDLQLARAREGLWGRIQGILGGNLEESLAQLEEILITSDFGIETTERLIRTLRQKAPAATHLDGALKDAVLEIFASVPKPFELRAKPTVIMVVGVNGVGKTTTIGKLAAYYGAQGKKVLLAAGDTFRAAAIDQLAIWAERAGADIVKGQPEGDPAAVCFDAIKAAQARGADLVICDTAGRLHTKGNLMEELRKVKRVMAKALPEAPHEVWLVLDATVGQNAMNQARQFHEAVGLTGLIMTKLDGTAKGGILVGLVEELKVPVRFIGVGEGISDLLPFDAEAYVEAVLGED